MRSVGDWAPSLQALIAGDDTVLVIRPIHAPPVCLVWPRVPGVTLFGDGAHVMVPLACEGANLAMLDGAALALVLTNNPGDQEGALKPTSATCSRVALALPISAPAPGSVLRIGDTAPPGRAVRGAINGGPKFGEATRGFIASARLGLGPRTQFGQPCGKLIRDALGFSRLKVAPTPDFLA